MGTIPSFFAAVALASLAACSTHIEGSPIDDYEDPGIGVADPDEDPEEVREEDPQPESVNLVEGDYTISFATDRDDCGLGITEPTMHTVTREGMQLELRAGDAPVLCDIIDPQRGEFECQPSYVHTSTGFDATTTMTRLWIGDFSSGSDLDGEILTTVTCEGSDCETIALLNDSVYPCQALEFISGELASES